jgi:transposase
MISGHGSKLPRKSEALIAALLTEPTIEAAAAKVDIGHSTARRWLRDPDFAQQYREARQDCMAQATARLQQATGEAVEGLREVLKKGESEAAKVSAARCILDSALRATELEDIKDRIEALEAAAEGK